MTTGTLLYGLRVIALGVGILWSLAACVPEPKLDSPAPTEAGSEQSWISVRGTVASTSTRAFQLDYGTGELTVKMSGWGWFPKGRSSLTGDEVVVYGRIDDEFYDKRTLEASSVYIKELGAQFFARGVDDDTFISAPDAVLEPLVAITGVVDRLTSHRFILKTGDGLVVVEGGTFDRSSDSVVGRSVERGDRVRVVGRIDEGVFMRKLRPKAITVLKGHDDAPPARKRR